jgi:hypothetical protein
VLAVPVQADHNVVIFLLGEFETGLDSPSDAQIEWMPNDRGACRFCHSCCIVDGTIVNYKYVCARHGVADATHNLSNCQLLVKSWYNHQ